ncbi:hypothetical protein KFK09_000324 [Dendrobium nobile]|uniref:Uncharacterized protein n=1 Tax=Dendrobium nobile TaxID=94219 RepID=A0A8T3CAS7_DENNO|nr:hypothetical protein KFK09_000324 [Dendrobium nobile]
MEVVGWPKEVIWVKTHVWSLKGPLGSNQLTWSTRLTQGLEMGSKDLKWHLKFVKGGRIPFGAHLV